MFGKIKTIFTDRKERQDQRNLKLVRNAKAIREDRWAAIQYFKEHDDPHVGVQSLLDRFEYSLEHGINDTREKEASMEGILGFKDKALPIVRERLAKTTRIAWPIKVLKALASDKSVVEGLISALNFDDVSFDQGQVDKNYDVLCYLRDYKLPDEVERLSHFLKDADERVRFACCEFLVEQENPAVAAMVEPFLSDQSAENLRLRQAAVEGFLNHGWKLKNPASFPNGQVVGNISVNASSQLFRR